MGKNRRRELSDEVLDLVANRFKMLAEPNRLKIIHTLGDDELSVGAIVTRTGLSQANVSKHLAALLDAGIVARRKEGLTSNYRVIDETVFALCDVVCSRLKDAAASHRRLIARL